MIIRLSQLIFCFALFYSSQSAAYNEAMCILIKQEMQQYSNNKASAKYRSAARDFKRNCNKPKQVQTKPKPVKFWHRHTNLCCKSFSMTPVTCNGGATDP